jgi:hypothetical protein
MFRALAEPREAAAWFDAHPACKLEGGNARPFMSHWLHTLDRLGVNDPAVVADTPRFAVFVRDGKRTHAVFNHGTKPATVRFSDGVTLTAKPCSLTTTQTRGDGSRTGRQFPPVPGRKR